MTIITRLADETDRDAITSLLEAAWLSEGYPASATTIDEVGPVFWNSVMDRQWVGVEDDLVVGHVAIRSATDYAYGLAFSEAMGVSAEDISVVCRLVVHPDHRRRGIARQLLGVAMSYGSHIALDAIAERHGAQVLYRQSGLIPIGDVMYNSGGADHVKTLWVNSLAP